MSATLERAAEARIADYVWALDEGGEEPLRECFAAAGRFAVEFGDERPGAGAEGREQVVELIATGLRAAPGRWHLVSNARHVPALEGFAWRTVCVVAVVRADGSGGPELESLGVYEFDFLSEDGGLRIGRLRLRVRA